MIRFALELDDIRKEGRKEGKRDSTEVTLPFLLESRPRSYWSRSRVSTGVTNEGGELTLVVRSNPQAIEAARFHFFGLFTYIDAQ